MEKGLLLKEVERDEGLKRRIEVVRWREIGEEMKRVSWLACPMVVVIMSQYLLQVISIMMVGHLGELYLSSTAIAVSLAGVTGFSLMVTFNSLFCTFLVLSFSCRQLFLQLNLFCSWKVVLGNQREK